MLQTFSGVSELIIRFEANSQRCCSSCVSVLPVGWAVGSLAGATQRGRRKKSQSEHHRAVIPLDGEVRRRAARPDSDNILRSHAVQQKGGLRRRKKLSNNSPPLTWKTTTNMRDTQSEMNSGKSEYSSWDSGSDLNKVEHAIRKTNCGIWEIECKEAPWGLHTIFWPDIPHRFPGLEWKSIFAVLRRNFLRAPDR